MRKLFVTCFVALLVSFGINAQTVEIDGVSYPDIASALEVASDGDTIDITGIHTETVQITNEDEGVTLLGTDPAADIIQAATDSAGGDSRVLTINKAATIQNLGIQNGNSGNQIGGGILVSRYVGEGTVKLINLVVKDNITGNKNGGGIAVEGPNDLVIEYCHITENVAQESLGGGLVFISKNNQNSTNYISNSVIENNISYGNGGGIYVTGQFGQDMLLSLDIENTIIAYNEARSGGNGGGAFFKGSPYSPGSGGYGQDGTNNIAISMKHVTVPYNDAFGDSGEGINFYGEPEFNIYNSIVSLNGDQEGTNTDMNFGGGYTENAINNIFGNTYYGELVLNNIDNKVGKFAGALKLDEEFTDRGGFVDVLATNGASIAIDSANIDYTNSYDIRDYSRSEDGGPDVGAYEFMMPEAITIYAEEDTLNIDDELQMQVEYTPAEADELYLFWDIITGEGSEIGDSGLFVATGSGTFVVQASANEPVPLSSNEFTIYVVSPTDAESLSGDQVEVYPNPAQNTLYVEGLDNSDSIDLYTLSGSMVKSAGSNQQINVGNIEPGVYLLVIKKDNERMAKKIVVK